MENNMIQLMEQKEQTRVEKRRKSMMTKILIIGIVAVLIINIVSHYEDRMKNTIKKFFNRMRKH